MAWISIDQSMIGDRLRILHKEIGCSRNEAIGILVGLWIWGIDNAKGDGSLPSVDLDDIAEQLTVGMNKDLDPERVAQILLETGWICEIDGKYKISDYDSVCGLFEKYEKERVAHNERTGRYRERKRLEKAKDVENDVTKDGTCDVTDKENEKPKEEKPKKRTQADKYGDDFEKLWEIYPRKDRKAEAFKCYLARIKDGHSPEVLMQAAQNYANKCLRERTEKQYTLMCRTFLGSNLIFRDYVQTGTTASAQDRQKIESGANPFR